MQLQSKRSRSGRALVSGLVLVGTALSMVHAAELAYATTGRRGNLSLRYQSKTRDRASGWEATLRLAGDPRELHLIGEDKLPLRVSTKVKNKLTGTKGKGATKPKVVVELQSTTPTSDPKAKRPDQVPESKPVTRFLLRRLRDGLGDGTEDEVIAIGEVHAFQGLQGLQGLGGVEREPNSAEAHRGEMVFDLDVATYK